MTYVPTCTFPGDREDALIDYLYGERGSPTARAFANHLAVCPVCRAEVGELGGVRQALGEWSPPEPLRALAAESAGPRRLSVLPRRAKSDSELRPIASHVAPASAWPLPAWARAAAVVACVGVGLGAANLRVGYGPDGLSVRTGWLQPPQAVGLPGPTADRSAPDPRADNAPWRAELTAVEEQLRSEMHQVPVATPGAPASDSDALLQRVKTLVSQSEQRQQRELALRLGDLRNDVHAQRLADLSRIERSIGVVQSSTGMEVLRQREMLNSLAVRVSQRQ